MPTIKKIEMFVVDYNDELTVTSFTDLINTFVLDRFSTNGDCVSKELGSVTIEMDDEFLDNSVFNKSDTTYEELEKEFDKLNKE